LENIKNKHLARRHDSKRHSNTTTTAVHVNNVEQKDYLNSLFSSSSSSPKSIGLVSMDNNNSTITSAPSPLSTLLTPSSDQSSSNYQYQRSSSQKFDPGQSPSYIDIKTPLFNELLTPTSSPSYIPVNHNPSTPVHSYMNASFQGTINDSTSPSSFTNHQYNTTYRY